MSDRHICKAKRTDNGEWVEGFCFEFKEKLYITFLKETNIHVTYTEEPSVVDFDMRTFEVDPGTVCQCTGLPDRNGKKIFENDIVKVTEDCEEIYLIKWDEDIARYVFVQNGSTIADFGDIYASDTEVIGNIFDNPELLEGGAE